jgi:hypothetical protein
VITKVEVFGEHRASTLSLGGLMPSDDPVHIRNIDGLGPVKADITTTPSGTSRGETKNGSSTGKRNIVLTLGFNPDWANQTITGLRKLLYGYFMTEQWIKLRFYSDEYPTVDIEGTVESCDPNQFSQDPEMQVSIINEKPDFIDIDASIYTGVVDIDGETWLEVDYEGSVSAGLELRIDRSVDNPAYTGPITVSVQNFKGTEILYVSAATIDTTKSLKISSVPGQKRVQNEALTDGAVTNLLRNKSGDWPLLQPGENLINVQANVPGQKWTLAYFNRFGGL